MVRILLRATTCLLLTPDLCLLTSVLSYSIGCLRLAEEVFAGFFDYHSRVLEFKVGTLNLTAINR